jgi:hypothetical protein
MDERWGVTCDLQPSYSASSSMYRLACFARGEYIRTLYTYVSQYGTRIHMYFTIFSTKQSQLRIL